MAVHIVLIFREELYTYNDLLVVGNSYGISWATRDVVDFLFKERIIIPALELNALYDALAA